MNAGLTKILISVGNILDTLFVVFLTGKAFTYFYLGLDTLAALFTCATALWCISHKIWHINNKLSTYTEYKER